MKKRLLALIMAMCMVVALVAACGGNDDNQGGSNDSGGTNDGGGTAAGVTPADYANGVYPTGPRGEGVTINLWGWNEEVYDAALAYKAANPDFKYEINLTTYVDTTGEYEQALNAALLSGGSSAGPDWFIAEQAFVINYTKFDFSQFAMPYEQLLGTDPVPIADKAEISKVIQEAGTNPDGKIVGLGFQSTGSGFIYRRSLAEQIWGTDDPAEIEKKIGPGWDKFTQAAAEAKAAGVYMVAGEGDLWQAIRQSPNPWIVDGKLTIDDQRMSFLDIGYTFYNEGYSLQASAWQEAWFGAMGGSQPVLGFLGPAWLINYTMYENSGSVDDDNNLIGTYPEVGTYGDWALCLPPEPFNWGGSYSIITTFANPDALPGIAELIYWLTLDTTNDGFQYGWANGTLGAAKDSVASGVVMAKSNGTLEYLGGQNAFDVFVPAGATGTASGWGPQDRFINDAFSQHATDYFSGVVDKDTAIANFKQQINDELNIPSE